MRRTRRCRRRLHLRRAGHNAAMDLCLLGLLCLGREDLGAGHDLERRGGHRGGEHDGRAEEKRGGAGDVVGGEEGDGHDDLCRLRVERERRWWAVGCVLVEERGSAVGRGGRLATVAQWSWVCGWMCGCVWVWVCVEVRQGGEEGSAWGEAETGGSGYRGPHGVRRQHIQSSAGGELTMTLWITRFALLAGMAVVAACWVDILTFLVCGGIASFPCGALACS